MSADSTRAALDAEVLAWMRETAWTADEARFDALALRSFAYQYAYCEPYRLFCDARGATPNNVTRWQDVPAVPTGAFKELRIASFEPDHDVKVFRTSGTTTARRGALHLDTLALYDASLLPTLRKLLFADLPPGERMLLRVLAPGPGEAPESSLSHMFGRLLDELGSDESGFDLRAGKLDVDGLLGVLDAADRTQPVALLGTAFAFVHLLDSQAERDRSLELPADSLAMETGGFKGQSREVPRDELHALISSRLGIDPARIVNQYGMTELGSQFYDSVLVDPAGERRKLGPPWVRVRLIDPTSNADSDPGQPGMIQIHDLANTGSVSALQTADLGRAVDGDPPGFEVLGRQPGAEQRGCSIAADHMLGRVR